MNRGRSTRNFFRNGGDWIGGALRLHLPVKARKNLAHRARRGLNSSCAPAIQKIPAKSGRAGLARTRNLGLAPSALLHASFNGKR